MAAGNRMMAVLRLLFRAASVPMSRVKRKRKEEGKEGNPVRKKTRMTDASSVSTEASWSVGVGRKRSSSGGKGIGEGKESEAHGDEGGKKKGRRRRR